ncbi:MAG: bacteriocin [Prevotella sp.]|nr:bacteriocin [Prevotella sp.]
MKPEDVKKEQELNEEELDKVSGGLAPKENELEVQRLPLQDVYKLR